ncbi:MAG: hypothetical protein JWO82_1773 [Akkermansiaceae bacterium]|nr:hypothetical protein [Akkermansiaceae bacterium]
MAPPKPRRISARGGTSIAQIGSLLLLLILPAWAVLRLDSPDYWIAAGIVLIMSIAATVATQRDKLKAEAGAWRTPESTLHLLELLGGWPGAFLAQRRYRHKTSKVSYQFTFWVIVLLYQIVAAGFLSHWRLIEHLIGWFNGLAR